MPGRPAGGDDVDGGEGDEEREADRLYEVASDPMTAAPAAVAPRAITARSGMPATFTDAAADGSSPSSATRRTRRAVAKRVALMAEAAAKTAPIDTATSPAAQRLLACSGQRHLLLLHDRASAHQRGGPQRHHDVHADHDDDGAQHASAQRPGRVVDVVVVVGEQLEALVGHEH